MDPIQLIWEVSKTLLTVASTLALPVAGLWLLARHLRGKRDNSERSR